MRVKLAFATSKLTGYLAYAINNILYLENVKGLDCHMFVHGYLRV